MEDVGINDDGLGGIYEAKGVVKPQPKKESRMSVDFSHMPLYLRANRFNELLNDAKNNIFKGVDSPAHYALAAFYLDYLQYVESGVLMEFREFESRFNTIASRLERYSKRFGAPIYIERRRYVSNK